MPSHAESLALSKNHIQNSEVPRIRELLVVKVKKTVFAALRSRRSS